MKTYLLVLCISLQCVFAEDTEPRSSWQILETINYPAKFDYRFTSDESVFALTHPQRHSGMSQVSQKILTDLSHLFVRHGSGGGGRWDVVIERTVPFFGSFAEGLDDVSSFNERLKYGEYKTILGRRVFVQRDESLRATPVGQYRKLVERSYGVFFSEGKIHNDRGLGYSLRAKDWWYLFQPDYVLGLSH